MKLKTKLRLIKAKKKLSNMWYDSMKPVAKAIENYSRNKHKKLVKKVESMTEEEVVDRIANNITRRLSDFPNGYEEIHVVGHTDDWRERHIRAYMVEECRGDKYIKQYGCTIDSDDIETQRRLTEMLYSRLVDEEVLDVKWETYENVSSYWRGYEKTLSIQIKNEYLGR